jgi:hypothetical protein
MWSEPTAEPKKKKHCWKRLGQASTLSPCFDGGEGGICLQSPRSTAGETDIAQRSGAQGHLCSAVPGHARAALLVAPAMKLQMVSGSWVQIENTMQVKQTQSLMQRCLCTAWHAAACPYKLTRSPLTLLQQRVTSSQLRTSSWPRWATLLPMRSCLSPCACPPLMQTTLKSRCLSEMCAPYHMPCHMSNLRGVRDTQCTSPVFN